MLPRFLRPARRLFPGLAALALASLIGSPLAHGPWTQPVIWAGTDVCTSGDRGGAPQKPASLPHSQCLVCLAFHQACCDPPLAPSALRPLAAADLRAIPSDADAPAETRRGLVPPSQGPPAFS